MEGAVKKVQCDNNLRESKTPLHRKTKPASKRGETNYTITQKLKWGKKKKLKISRVKFERQTTPNI